MMNSNRAIAKSSFTAETQSAQRQRREEKTLRSLGGLCASAVNLPLSVEPYFFITTK